MIMVHSILNNNNQEWVLSIKIIMIPYLTEHHNNKILYKIILLLMMIEWNVNKL